MIFFRSHHFPHPKRDPDFLLHGRCLAVLVSALHSEVDSMLINFGPAKPVELILIHLDKIKLMRLLILNIKVNYVISEKS